MHSMEKQFTIGMALFFIAILFMVMAGLHLVATSLALAVLSLFGLTILYSTCPTWLKRLITCKPVMYPLDIIISLSVPGLIGFTLTGVLGGIIMGILVTFSLKFEHMRLRRMFSWQRGLQW